MDTPTTDTTPDGETVFALSGFITRRVEAQADAILSKAGIQATITHVALNDNPAWPDTYKVMLERELTKDERRDIQKHLRGIGVAGLDWLFFKPNLVRPDEPPRTGGDDESAEASADDLSPSAPDPTPIAPEQAATPQNAANGTVDLKDARIADLEAQIAELTAQRLAGQPAIAEAIREELRTFPTEPGTRYFVGEITYEQNQRVTAAEFDRFEAECAVVCEEFKGFDTGQRPKLWHVARGKRRTNPTENGANAKTFAVVDMPEQPTKTAVSGKIVQDSAPLVSVFTNLMRRNPLVEQVWTRGPDAVMEDMLAEGNRLAVDFIFEHLASRDTLALVEVDDLQ